MIALSNFLQARSSVSAASNLVLVFITLFIQKRPKGLLPQKGRAAE